MGLLAVVLPMLLLFPAATALYIDARVGGIGVAAAGGGLAVSCADQFRPSIGYFSWLSLVAALLALGAGGVALLSAAGRAVLPIVTGLAAFMVAAKCLAGGLGGLGNNFAGQSGPRGHFGVSEVVVPAVAPLLLFILTQPSRREPTPASQHLASPAQNVNP